MNKQRHFSLHVLLLLGIFSGCLSFGFAQVSSPTTSDIVKRTMAAALARCHFKADGVEAITFIPVLTENSVRSENTEVPTIREIMVATTMSSLLVALFALVASSFRTRAALQAEILALRHQLAVFQKNVPGRLLHRLGDPLLPLRDVDAAFPSQLSAVRQLLSRDRGISSLSRAGRGFSVRSNFR